MAQPSPKEFHAKLKSRLEAWRGEQNWTQQQMADALGVEWESYKKMEQRGRVPPHLFEKLALVTHETIEWWITGRGRRLRLVKNNERQGT